MNLFEKLKELRAKKEENNLKIQSLKDDIIKLAKEENEEEARAKSLEKEKIEVRNEFIDEQINELLEQIEENRSNLPTNIRKNKNYDNETRNLQLRAISKVLRKRELTDEERSIISVDDNAAVIPQEFIKEMELLRQGYVSLKNNCHIIPVNSSDGKMPVRANGSVNRLAELGVDEEITKAMIKTEATNFSIKDYGLLAPISNTLLEDSGVNFLDFVNQEFIEFAINTENYAIIESLKSALATETANDITDIIKAINKLSPNARKRAVIITNNKGRAYLDSLVDKQGRPLLKELSDGSELTFKGRSVLEVDESIYDTEEKTVFIIADTKTLVKFFDRKQYTIDSSSEAGYIKNQTLVRIIERFDVVSPNTTTEIKRKFGVIVEMAQE